jgi:nitroreductase
MQSIIDDLNWRYAVKKFDTKRTLNPKDVDVLAETMRLTATSYGLMPFRLIIVDDHETKNQLRDASWGQSQLSDASHVFVLCSIVQPSRAEVDNYMQLISKEREIPRENLNAFADNLMKKLENSPNLSDWSARQAYIALGALLTVCASRRIDACPIEGFDPQQYDQILNLAERGLRAVLAIPVGYRAKDDKYQFVKKVRLAKEDFVISKS